jgi:RNA polymerase sigma-70 factor (ECF subfamily)
VPALSDSALADTVARGRAEWPGIELGTDIFAAYLAERGENSADLYLACACARRDPVARAAFDAHILPHIEAALRVVLGATAPVAELAARVRAEILDGDAPRIAEYKGRGPLAGWARIVAARHALPLVPGRHEPPLGPEPTQLDPRAAQVRERHRDAFRAAFAAAFAEHSPHERNLLLCSALEELPAPQLAALYGTDEATLARWLTAIRAALEERVRARLATRPGLTGPELEGLLDLLRSRGDLAAELELV